MRFWFGGVDEAEKEDATRMIAEKRVVVVELALIASATSSIHT